MSCFDTCFFERYAHETLRRCLGHDFDGLVNRDRPDLQSPDGMTWGIEVTRAMEESKAAADILLDNMSGMTEMEEDDADGADLEQLLRSGYGYGLMVGRNLSPGEHLYWSMALPMKRILESKVGKMTGGFYGSFERTGLYVFCKDPVSDVDVLGACHRVLDLQEGCELRYDFLYLSEVNVLHVCNLSDDISDQYRIADYDIPMEMRRELYYSALD